jgi:hypothetical protein
MGWGVAAGKLGVGLLADKFFGSSPNEYSPWDQADAAFNANPNTQNYFGNTSFTTEDPKGTRKNYRDDVRTVTNTMSPQMQALADRMMGMMGRGQQTFTSAMPGSKMQGYMNDRIGRAQPATYDRSGYGFDQPTTPVPTPTEPDESQYEPQAWQDIMQALYSTHRN